MVGHELAQALIEAFTKEGVYIPGRVYFDEHKGLFVECEYTFDPKRNARLANIALGLISEYVDGTFDVRLHINGEIGHFNKQYLKRAVASTRGAILNSML